jgi:hypothetical protein
MSDMIIIFINKLPTFNTILLLKWYILWFCVYRWFTSITWQILKYKLLKQQTGQPRSQAMFSRTLSRLFTKTASRHNYFSFVLRSSKIYLLLLYQHLDIMQSHFNKGEIIYMKKLSILKYSANFLILYFSNIIFSCILLISNKYGFSWKHTVVSFSKTSILIVFEKFFGEVFSKLHSKPYYYLY